MSVIQISLIKTQCYVNAEVSICVVFCKIYPDDDIHVAYSAFTRQI